MRSQLLLHCPTVASPERILVNLENILAELRSERARIDQAISALEGLAGPSGSSPWASPEVTSCTNTTPERRRTMSAAARKRISDAMKQRWAKWKGKVCSQEGQRAVLQ